MVDTTKKFFTTMALNDVTTYDTYEAAAEKATRRVAQYAQAGNCSYTQVVFEAVATIKSPVPEAVVTKLA